MSNDSEDIVNRIAAVESDFENASIQLQDSKSLLQLITRAHDKINRLIDGTVPVELQYNTDVIFNGKGTAVDKTIENKIKINNTVYGYSLGEAWIYNMSGEALAARLTTTTPFDANVNGQGADKFAIWTKLQEYTNRLSLNGLLSSDPNNDLNIYIDDSSISWKVGQTLKIVFDTIDMQGNSIKIYSDKVNRFDKLIAEIDVSQLLTNKPYIEIVCVDPTTYLFEADILR
jgi:hypothetical protein